LLFPIGGVGVDRVVGEVDAVHDVEVRPQPPGEVDREVQGGVGCGVAAVAQHQPGVRLRTHRPRDLQP
jgi:hypothetical protein